MTDRNRDFQPEKGQQSNQNWDDQNDQLNDQDQQTRSTSDDQDESSDRTRAINERNTSGAGSSQRTATGDTGYGDVGPLDSDLERLPSEKRRDRGNLSGPGLG